MNEYYLRVMDCENSCSEMWKVKGNSEQEAIDNIENNFENNVKAFAIFCCKRSSGGVK